MCGICGVVDHGGAPMRDTVVRMTESLRHRGPDDVGIEVRGAASLGFRRLSIIDLAGSHQPMSNEDDSLWLLFNGEIYNFEPLRRELEAKGHRFKTSGDGEVILHLYEECGDRFVDRLNGMFGIALWDERRERLLLARDRLGIKPLYYTTRGSRLAFSSEIKALLEVEGIEASLDLEAIAGYMNYSSMPGPRTGLQGVHHLPPAHVAVFDREGLRLERYWDVAEAEKVDRPEEELVELVDGQLRDSVGLRMVSDVPLGVFLSGGVDSSLIAALVAEHSAKPVEAFSIGYGREGAFMNELEHAREVAQRYGMQHHELVLDSHDLLRDVDRVAWFLDEPCGDPAAFLTLALSEFTRRHVTVTLSGLGADELFAGYRRYAAISWQGRYRRIPRSLREGLIRPALELLPESRTSRLLDRARLARKFARSVTDDVKSSWARTISYLPEYEGPIFTGEMAAATRASFTCETFEDAWARTASMPHPVDRVMYMDTQMYMVDQLLLLQDKMSMAASLEARVPFLDHRLVELAASIPVGRKLEGGVLKRILKRVAERYVPGACIYRPKQGFAAPVEAWLHGPLREPLEEALSPERVRARGVFEVEFVETLKRRFYAGGSDLSLQLYNAFMLETWIRQVVDGEGRRFRGTVSPALPG